MPITYNVKIVAKNGKSVDLEFKYHESMIFIVSTLQYAELSSVTITQKETNENNNGKSDITTETTQNFVTVV